MRRSLCNAVGESEAAGAIAPECGAAACIRCQSSLTQSELSNKPCPFMLMVRCTAAGAQKLGAHLAL